MIDIRALEKNENGFLDEYRACLKNRKQDPSSVDKLLELNSRRKSLVSEFEAARAEQNRVGQEIAKLKREKKSADDLLEKMQVQSEKVKEMDQQIQGADLALQELLLVLPNKCHSSVPVGSSAENNELIRRVGEPGKFSFQPKDHAELGEKLGILDFERGGKVTGARFTFLRKGAAELERVLIQFMLDLHTREHGYEEMMPPFVVNGASLLGTGQFPKFRDDVFHLEGADYHLVPTAEVPVTNYFNGEILEVADLPISFAAYTPCFRSEAGSYGRDTRGLIRQHQFNKVELVKFSHPDSSYEDHEKLLKNAERVLQLLELPYQVMNLCTGDIGFGAAKCFDIEVWLPGQKAYREISSCSNFEDFQARRANIRFRPGPKDKPRFVHTINGSGLAVGRTLVAILENYQKEDGTIQLPQVLHKYSSKKEIRPV